jgi:cellobiose transport system permease protein
LSKLDVKYSPYGFIAPFFILFVLVGLFPIVYTLFISTRKWNSIAGDQGMAVSYEDRSTTSLLGNFEWVVNNPTFPRALLNTFSIFILSSGPQIIIAIALAAILSANLRAKTFWRMGVLLPYVIAPMAAGIIFRQIFADETGVANQILTMIGLDPIGWHSNSLASHIAIATIINFRWTGYNTLVILAAMQAVPNEVLEAGVVDGASRWRQLISIQLPMIRPTLIFVIITSTIGGLQVFDEPQMFSLSSNYGGSSDQFLTVTQFLWETGFVSTGDSNMGRAAAVAWILFIFVVCFAILSYLLTSRIASTGSAPTKTKKVAK